MFDNDIELVEALIADEALVEEVGGPARGREVVRWCGLGE